MALHAIVGHFMTYGSSLRGVKSKLAATHHRRGADERRLSLLLFRSEQTILR
jgi:hypothetical protein